MPWPYFVPCGSFNGLDLLVGMLAAEGSSLKMLFFWSRPLQTHILVNNAGLIIQIIRQVGRKVKPIILTCAAVTKVNLIRVNVGFKSSCQKGGTGVSGFSKLVSVS